jgi:hypothetical protein
MDKIIKHSEEIVLFYYADGTQGAWTKNKDFTLKTGYKNDRCWTPNANYPTVIQYTDILEMADRIPAIGKQLEQLMLLYNMNKEDLYGSKT